MKHSMGTIKRKKRRKNTLVSNLFLIAALAITIFAAAKIMGIIFQYRAGEQEYDSFIRSGSGEKKNNYDDVFKMSPATGSRVCVSVQ